MVRKGMRKWVRSLVCAAVALTLALTLMPVPQAFANEADTATNASNVTSAAEAATERPDHLLQTSLKLENPVMALLEDSGIAVISVTTPVYVTFGSEVAYDIEADNPLATFTATAPVTFQNTGTAYARMAGITCTDRGAQNLLTKTDGTTPIDETNQIFKLSNSAGTETAPTATFGPIAGTSNANTVAASELGTSFDIPDKSDSATSGAKTFTYTLDLTDTQVNTAAVDKMEVGGSVSMELASVVYTFEAATTTITWNLNYDGAPDPTTDTSYVSSSSNPTLTLPTQPERTSYTFLGWFTEDGTQVNDGDAFPTETTTYYAHWEVETQPFFLAAANSSDLASETIIKTAAEIKADSAQIVAEKDLSEQPTIELYESFMKGTYGGKTESTANEIHLYTQLAGTDGINTNDWVECRIVGINQDIDANGNTVGLTFQAIHCLPTAYQMNTANTNTGGWQSSELRAKMQAGGEIYGLFDSAFTDQVVKVKKASGPGKNDTSVFITQDTLWIASYMELVPTAASRWYDKVNLERTSTEAPANQFDYWSGKVTENYSGGNACLVDIYKTRDGSYPKNYSYLHWWERSAYSDTVDHFFIVGTDGATAANYDLKGRAYNYGGVVPCFCI